MITLLIPMWSQTLVPTVSLKKRVFTRIPTYHAGYPNGPSISPMGSHPCAWSQSLATKPCRKPRKVEYLHGPSIIPMGSQTFVPTVSLKTSFPWIPTYPAGYTHGPSTTPMGRTPILGPNLRQQSPAARPKNTYSWSHRDTLSKGLPEKRVCTEYPPGGLSTHMVPL